MKILIDKVDENFPNSKAYSKKGIKFQNGIRNPNSWFFVWAVYDLLLFFELQEKGIYSKGIQFLAGFVDCFSCHCNIPVGIGPDSKNIQFLQNFGFAGYNRLAFPDCSDFLHLYIDEEEPKAA